MVNTKLLNYNKKTAVKLQASVIAEEIIYINVSPEFNCNFFY